MSCWTPPLPSPPLPGSRFNTFQAAPVSTIFNLFSQAGSTDAILFGISVPLHSETLNTSLSWDIKVGTSLCMCLKKKKKNLAISRGVSHRRFTDGTGSFVTAEKTKRTKCQGRRVTVLRGTAEPRRAESKCWIKYERRTVTAL